MRRRPHRSARPHRRPAHPTPTAGRCRDTSSRQTLTLTRASPPREAQSVRGGADGGDGHDAEEERRLREGDDQEHDRQVPPGTSGPPQLPRPCPPSADNGRLGRRYRPRTMAPTRSPYGQPERRRRRHCATGLRDRPRHVHIRAAQSSRVPAKQPPGPPPLGDAPGAAPPWPVPPDAAARPDATFGPPATWPGSSDRLAWRHSGVSAVTSSATRDADGRAGWPFSQGHQAQHGHRADSPPRQ